MCGISAVQFLERQLNEQRRVRELYNHEKQKSKALEAQLYDLVNSAK